MILRWLLCGLVLPLVAAAAPEPGFQRVAVGRAVVSLRADATAPAHQGALWLHLHGAADTVEAAFARSGAPGVLVTLTLPGLSGVYAEHFADPAVFDGLLRDVTSAVRGPAAGEEWSPGELTVSSFSAGFGGVRQLLRQPDAFDRIAALVLADSLYCGYAGPVAERRVDPALMAGFLRFARLAAEGRRRMLVTHSQQVPPGYASTTETADYLIAALGGRREPAVEAWADNLRQQSAFGRGGFQVFGFAGTEAEDHLRHLRSLGPFLDRVRARP